MPQIFLNYRTEDEKYGVALLDEVLSRRFGADAVFLASKSIELGAPWEAAMFEAVANSDALLVVMGRGWLAAADGQGGRRIDDPADFVRREIKLGLELDKQVIPVRLDVPRVDPADLPEDIRGLTERQDIEVRFRNREIDVNRLADKLGQLIPTLRPPADKTSTNKFTVQAHQVGQVWQAEQMTFGDFHV